MTGRPLSTPESAIPMASILIIDDNEAFRAALGETLVGLGHVVTEAGNGFDAARIYRESPTDIILTDLVMPQGGLSVIQVLRSQFPSVAVIAMSGGGSQRLDYARTVGAHHALSKPFSAEQLTAAIAEALAAVPEPEGRPGAPG
jgi:CheY-like chemotaxis protein